MKKLILTMLIPAVLILSNISFAASDSNGGQSKIALLCLTYGIEQLEKSRDKTLPLTKAQAVVIHEELTKLAQLKLFLLDVNDRETRGSNGVPPSEQERLKWQKRQSELNKRINESLAKMEKILTPKQISFIDNLDINPQEYAILEMGPQEGGQSWSPVQQTKNRDLRERGLKKLVDLNNRVLEMVKRKCK